MSNLLSNSHKDGSLGGEGGLKSGSGGSLDSGEFGELDVGLHVLEGA